jgi:DNA-binding transcriptional MerR regulator
MRIGELAELAGVTTRTVRHYHHLGLLPEPTRRANGSRAYGLRHAVLLVRIRRLAELGLGLAEVRDVLADEAGRELAEVLAELDADLARQQAALAARRAQLAGLIERARGGALPPEGPVSPELAELFGALGGADSPMAAKDRAHLALLDSLDEVTTAAGGAVYPAKDARMSPATFRQGFPRWQDVEAYRDPAFMSSFWRRVTGGRS